ncbi:putative holin-like toxin [Enterococcus faecalis]|nr:putative holin-like toxin [Enterococcus faecalis]EGO9001864.1 putative holin-like toxin [Enterococcus faecalis]MBM9830758.1 putative holin-like toxin [Enterococcus faecalis]NSW10576.1 putative holin-like toxin [Enterococcus faecalis]TQB32000.1 putative holin-like toxin [Enterococcus faecalis]
MSLKNTNKIIVYCTTNETIQTILGFGMFTIALMALIVKLLKEDNKK